MRPLKATPFPARNCYRVVVPPDRSGNGRYVQKYFKDEKTANEWIRQQENPTPAETLAKMPAATMAEAGGLWLEVERLGMTFHQAVEALGHYKERTLSLTKTAKVLKAAELFIEHVEHEQKSERTIAGYLQAIRRLCDFLGSIECSQITSEKLREYLLTMEPGTTRLSHQKNFGVFIRWLKAEGYTATDLMVNVPKLDKWGVNNETLETKAFRRILAVCAGLEAPAKADDKRAHDDDKSPTDRYSRLLPFYVLGGLAGIRRCEILDNNPTDPRIQWTDILWKKNLIEIRDEVAKQTKRQNRRRLIPLEPAAAAWLRLVSRPAGAVLELSQSQFQRLNIELLHKLRVKVPDNALRNSYATYGCAYKSPGDVARAMGDLESTVRRHYVGGALDAAEGLEWFNSFPGGSEAPAAGKIVAMA